MRNLGVINKASFQVNPYVNSVFKVFQVVPLWLRRFYIKLMPIDLSMIDDHNFATLLSACVDIDY